MRNWKVTGKYPTFNELGKVESTHIIITAEDGAVIPQLIKKDLTGTNDIEIIKVALEEFKKSEFIEIAMGEAVQKVDDLEKLSQETAKTATTAQAAAGLAKVSAERTQKMINLQTIHVLTTSDKVEPDIYKGMLELIESAKKGEYKAYDVFTVVDTTKEEDGEAGEGNLVFVHVNEPFEYDKQTLEELEEEEKVTVIKYADLVKGK
ncbi:TPA: DUF1366 domain-containing protein [Streptococcus equi subsp. zooepidemicus]|uniref:DUF1366 domain-containing protein n=1 Tax=Streptococcus equi TaxID=1336 RepID=UPI0013F5C327|nr:DUF1366 domain-containing protein [Streptococcus equi]MCD3462306.1 DUF1366 domain-containing protein [Streptococcus equi subsp. zooepidemicus]HEL0067266.1 DUF1366 domain-containing protein [Streptococcus equi subsp. zooepidemicus]HEL0075514.1 DUF1366 domain-containing protein [Streptococcus equi subsp. zooepidemicus]HEL0089546.1 DUF1366 domain-containing protein [Streptococcus equi subsp. zooepidemicus]HEL0218404.1 DUF1366 domain-containing protein [Streptococcus equi subsp. zooepidemicus]